MKVLHYVDENNLAWARPWLQLIRYLETRGIQNHIVCRPEGTLARYVLEQHIGLTTYKPPVAALPKLCRGISAIIRSMGPDLIHTRLSSAAMIGGYWGRRLGVPVISTIDKYPKRKYYLNSDKIVPCSSAVAAHMKNIGFPESVMELIYNPVNPDEYRRDITQRHNFRESRNIAEKDFIILGAGRFVDWKGFDTLIKACAKLRGSNSVTRHWQLWLVGDGPEMAAYEKCAAESGMSDRTRFWGFQSDIKQFLWAADLFVQPSREPEGFSLMLLEAMAAGVPAIATSIGGSLDIIDDNRSGWLFEPDDVKKLTETLQRLLLKDSLDEYAHNASRKAETFSVEAIGEQTVRFYESVIHKKRSR